MKWGLTDHISPHWGKGSISDDSQMMLFVLESLIMARVRLREADFDQRVQPRLETQIALAQWLYTQGVEWNAVLPPDMRPEPAKRYWKLIAYPELHVQRAPDAVSMSALGAFASSIASGPARKRRRPVGGRADRTGRSGRHRLRSPLWRSACSRPCARRPSPRR